jgi:hypothetical protein
MPQIYLGKFSHKHHIFQQYYETAVPEPRTVPEVPVGPQGDATDSVKSPDVADSSKPADELAKSDEHDNDAKNSNEFNFEKVDSVLETESVESKVLLEVENTTRAAVPAIEEEKVSQGSDDVFYDSDDDVFCDDNQNIPFTPYEKRRNFCLVSRTDMKPVMGNADFLADAIRGCGQNGFVMPSSLSMCPTMSNVIENPISNNTTEDATVSSQDSSAGASAQKRLDFGASAVASNENETNESTSRVNVSEMSNPSDADLTANQGKVIGPETISPRINGASNHTDFSTGNLSDEDVVSSVQDLLCEIKNLTNGTTSDVDIEPSTDSSDITDGYELTDQNLLTGQVKTISLDEQDIIRPVICSKGRSSPENLEDTLKADDQAEL